MKKVSGGLPGSSSTVSAATPEVALAPVGPTLMLVLAVPSTEASVEARGVIVPPVKLDAHITRVDTAAAQVAVQVVEVVVAVVTTVP